MIVKTHILRELTKLDKLYNQATVKGRNSEADFYAKIAFIELCGWTEDSIDDLALRSAKRKGVALVYGDFEEKIKYVYGFEYKKHFRTILFNTIGVTGVERVEKKVNRRLQVLLISALNDLWKKRHHHAHSYLRRSAVYLDAPTITLRRFWNIYWGLVEYDKKMRKCRY